MGLTTGKQTGRREFGYIGIGLYIYVLSDTRLGHSRDTSFSGVLKQILISPTPNHNTPFKPAFIPH